jgi:hypothetical protein
MTIEQVGLEIFDTDLGSVSLPFPDTHSMDLGINILYAQNVIPPY